MNAYRYIYEIYKEKSFSKAAANLYITQPSLSVSVRRIEAQLGYPIFDRSSVTLNLTEAGKAYVQAAEQILEIERNLSDYLADVSGMKNGHIVVSGSALYSSYVLGPIIKTFRERYPGISFEFVEGDSLLLYEQSLKNHIDLIVDGGEVDEIDFECRDLFKEHILLGISKANLICEKLSGLEMTVDDIQKRKYLDVNQKGIDLSILKNEKFILLQKGHDLYRRAIELCSEWEFIPKTELHMNQLMTAFHIATDNLGCIFLTDTLAEKAKEHEEMLYFKINTKNPELLQRPVFIAYRKNRQRTRAMEMFIQTGQELYQ